MIASPHSVVLEFARVDDTHEPYTFRFMPQDYLLRTPGGGFERARLGWDQTLLHGLERLREGGADPVLLHAVGEALRAFVAPLGWERLADQIRDASAHAQRTVVTIRSAAAELYALPWELLTLKASGQHLGALPGVLLRYEWPETATAPERPVPRDGPGRVLLAWSAAGGMVPAMEHARHIEEACLAGAVPFSRDRDIVANLSLSRLRATLAAAKKDRQPIAVLHLLAHGGPTRSMGDSYGLVLDGEGEAGGAVTVDAGRLGQILAPYADMIRLVVLSACDGGNPGALGNTLGSTAQMLHRAGIAAVVASRFPLSVRGSIRMTGVLYAQLLGQLASLESALCPVRDALADDAGTIDWASVQLYARCADGFDTRPILFRPYVGLASYGVEQRRFYFGRQTLIARLSHKLRTVAQGTGRPQLLCVIGPSGSGKSSLLRAGLLSLLEQQPLEEGTVTRTLLFRPDAHPLYALAAQLRTLPVDPRPARIVIVVDQFEEIYTRCIDEGERRAFTALLLHTAQSEPDGVLIVVGLRSDFLGETLRRDPELNRVLCMQTVLVPAMTQAELREAICAPAALLGRPFDESLLELLLLQGRGGEGSLPLLSFALSRLWEDVLQGQDPVATLRALGGVGGALASRAQQLFDALAPGQQAMVRRALLRLINVGDGVPDTRKRVPVRDLCGAGTQEQDLLATLRELANEQSRLLVLSDEEGLPQVELAHDALIEHWTSLRTWVNEARADRLFHQRVTAAARLWEETGGPNGRLLRSPDLDLLIEFQTRNPDALSDLEASFLAASRRVIQNERERQHRARQKERVRRSVQSTLLLSSIASANVLTSLSLIVLVVLVLMFADGELLHGFLPH